MDAHIKGSLVSVCGQPMLLGQKDRHHGHGNGNPTTLDLTCTQHDLVRL
jgi:hypothetical protein